jgi:hypothetical protein
MEQIMNNQINWNKILIHKEQKLDKKEQNFCKHNKIMNSSQTKWNNILGPEKQTFQQEGTTL